MELKHADVFKVHKVLGPNKEKIWISFFRSSITHHYDFMQSVKMLNLRDRGTRSVLQYLMYV